MTPPRSRIAGWDVALNAWVRSVLGKPYVLGEADCVQLVRGAYRAMYGVEVWPIGEYRTVRGAIRQMRAAGGVRAQLDRVGAVEVDPRLAQNGDIAMDTHADEVDDYGFALGIVYGRGVVATSEDAGVTIEPRATWPTILRVQHG